MAQQHEMVGNPYLMRYYQELLPSLRRSHLLTLNISRRELQESFDLFKLVTEAILIRKSPSGHFIYGRFLSTLAQPCVGISDTDETN